jgi:hypothetical protein
MRTMSGGWTPFIIAVMSLVAKAQGQTFLVDLGPTTVGGQVGTTDGIDANGNMWSNFSPGQFVRLRDTEGNSSAGSSGNGIGFSATTPVGSNGGAGYGLLDPDPSLLGSLAVATATQDNCFRFDDGSGDPELLTFELTELNPEFEYSFRFFACRFTDGLRETEYTVTGGNGSNSVRVVTSGTGTGSSGSNGNDSVVVGVDGVSPDAIGKIRIDLRAVQGQFCYLNAMEIIAEGGASISISEQPSGIIVDAGGTLTFAARVSSSDPAATSLQWERDGAPISDGGRVSGAETDTLTIVGAMAADVGAYRLVAAIDDLVVTSEDAVAAVRGSPAGIADQDGNGIIDFFDMLAFLKQFDAAGP